MAINVILTAIPEPESRWKTLEPCTKTCGGQVDKTAQTYWKGTRDHDAVKLNPVNL